MTLDTTFMATAKPDDKQQPPRPTHTGHGAASLIPYLRARVAPAEPEPADAAPPQASGQTPAQAPAEKPPQAK